MKKNKHKAVVLLSGGVDSATTLAIAQGMGFEIYALSFCYGQRHVIELKAAENIAKKNKVTRHLILNIDLQKIGGSALTADIKVPRRRSIRELKKSVPVLILIGLT